MLRYCTYCDKDFEFDPKAITAKEELICPECGNIIDKNSRSHHAQNKETASDGMSDAVSVIFRIAYVFYLVLAIIGIFCFIKHMYMALYIVTAISLIAYVLQLITGTVVFTSGIILLPLGAVVGYLLLGGISGACVAIQIVFLVRHIIRNILWTIVEKLISCSKD